MSIQYRPEAVGNSVVGIVIEFVPVRVVPYNAHETPVHENVTVLGVESCVRK